MRMRIWPVLCAVALLSELTSAASAQSIKLVAPNVGWMVPAPNRVLWTTDGGLEWKNITPPAPEDAVIAAIFFLNTSRGWVLFERGEAGDEDFDLASTGNAGATWSMAPLKIPDRLSRLFFNGGASLAFADPDHGFLVLAVGLTPIPGNGAVLGKYPLDASTCFWYIIRYEQV